MIKLKKENMKLLEGKTAIVTGAARGIGKAIALRFAAEGCNIAFTDLVIDENGKTTEKEIEALGVKAKGYASNAASFEATHQVVEEIVKDFGRIDILVNNAGITKDGLMMRMSEEDYDRVLDTNLKGAFLCCKAVCRPMMRQKFGRIINLSSVVGVRGNAGQANYAASKAGLIGLTKSLAKELAAKNITVNAVAPGFIETDMTHAMPEAARQATLASIPMGHTGAAEDVARAVAFFAAKENSYVTGQVLCIDGGMAV